MGGGVTGERKENNDGNSGHYVAASRPPNRALTATPPLLPISEILEIFIKLINFS